MLSFVVSLMREKRSSQSYGAKGHGWTGPLRPTHTYAHMHTHVHTHSHVHVLTHMLMDTHMLMCTHMPLSAPLCQDGPPVWDPSAQPPNPSRPTLPQPSGLVDTNLTNLG